MPVGPEGEVKNRSSAIVVRRFEPDDAEAVAAMMKDLAAFHGEDASATASDFTFYTSGSRRISDVWVVRLDREPCAFAATYDWMNYVSGFPVRNIDLFFVRESFRRRGVGRTLLKSLAYEARTSGCQRVTVGAEVDNESANLFYQKIGFELRRSGSNKYAISGASLDQLCIVEGNGPAMRASPGDRPRDGVQADADIVETPWSSQEDSRKLRPTSEADRRRRSRPVEPRQR